MWNYELINKTQFTSSSLDWHIRVYTQNIGPGPKLVLKPDQIGKQTPPHASMCAYVCAYVCVESVNELAKIAIDIGFSHGQHQLGGREEEEQGGDLLGKACTCHKALSKRISIELLRRTIVSVVASSSLLFPWWHCTWYNILLASTCTTECTGVPRAGHKHIHTDITAG